jgi:hypothetical protein
MNTRSVFIEIRTWRDTQNGNTYSTAEIWANGVIVAGISRSYGDATQRLHEAKAALIELGVIPPIRHFSELANDSIDFYTATIAGKKSELHKTNTQKNEGK